MGRPFSLIAVAVGASEVTFVLPAAQPAAQTHLRWLTPAVDRSPQALTVGGGGGRWGISRRAFGGQGRRMGRAPT